MEKLVTVDNFGNIDADRDELLFDCFEDHPAYQDVINFRKNIVIGKKGSGKTAIYKKILNMSNPFIFTSGHKLSSYPWPHHTLQALSGIPENEKYINSWKYLLLITLSKIIINSDCNIPFDSQSYESRNRLETFLKDSYGTSNPDIVNIFQPQYKLKFSPFIGAKFAGQEYGLQLPLEQIAMTELPQHIYEVNKNVLEHVLACLHPEHKYYICFDELDIGFSLIPEYYAQIIGLIRAASELNLSAYHYKKQFNICIFLRDDIYNMLEFEDKRKITANCVVNINWDCQGSKSTLKVLMEKRFTKLLKSQPDEKVRWDNVFNETKNINGKNTKYNYLLDMTCLRPRDIIDFCNIILEKYKGKPDEGNLFNNAHIIDAKSDYSFALMDEFRDEIPKHLPDYILYFDMIRTIGRSKFDFPTFTNAFNQFKVRLNDPTKDNPLSVCEALFQFSIIGNFVIGGRISGSSKVFSYKDSNLHFRDDLKIIVHPGLASALGLREKS